jgi:hypothetical protein
MWPGESYQAAVLLLGRFLRYALKKGFGRNDGLDGHAE